jgi:putative endonuclease
MDLVRSIAGLLSRFAKCSFPSTKAEENAAHALGRRGEQLAVKHLRRNGRRVLRRNFRHGRGGEVDIVCRDLRTGELVFVEVKTRRTLDYGDPAHAVNREKRDLVAKGAMAWLRLLDWPDIRFRFDVVEVILPDHGKPDINVIESAFHLPDRYRI